MSIEALTAKLDLISGEPDDEVRRFRDQWISDVQDLYSDVEDWLEPIQDRTRFHVSNLPHKEQGIGWYHVFHLTLFIDGVSGEISFTPVGSQVVGVRLADGQFVSGISGMVSLSFGFQKVPLVRRPGSEGWLVSTREEPALHPLDQDVLTTIIVGMLDGE